MTFMEFVGFTPTNGSSSVFRKFVSPGIKNGEMSQDAKGLFPLAGGLGVPEAWCTAVVAYVPAEAAASGRRIITTTTAAARGIRFLMRHLPSDRTENGRPSSSHGLIDVNRSAARPQRCTACSRRPPLRSRRTQEASQPDPVGPPENAASRLGRDDDARRHPAVQPAPEPELQDPARSGTQLAARREQRRNPATSARD